MLVNHIDTGANQPATQDEKGSRAFHYLDGDFMRVIAVDDFVIPDDNHVGLNLLCDTLGGPAAHLELHRMRTPPQEHERQQARL